MKNIKVTFSIGDKVKVKQLGIKGRVSGIFVGLNRTEYQVRYIYDGGPKDIYFLEEELEPVTEEDIEINPLQPIKK